MTLYRTLLVAFSASMATVAVHAQEDGAYLRFNDLSQHIFLGDPSNPPSGEPGTGTPDGPLEINFSGGKWRAPANVNIPVVLAGGDGDYSVTVDSSALSYVEQTSTTGYFQGQIFESLMLSARVTDGKGEADDTSAFLQVNPPLIVEIPDIHSVRVGQSVDIHPIVHGAVGTIGWSISSSPKTLSIDQGTGAIGGEFSEPVVVQAVATAVDSDDGAEASSDPFEVSIVDKLEALAPSQVDGIAGTSFSSSASAAGVLGSASWHVAPDSAPLPEWLSLNSSTGLLSGTSETAAEAPGLILTVVDSFDSAEASTPAFNVSISQDVVPDAFSVPAVTNATPQMDVISAEVTPTGFNGRIPIVPGDGATVSVAGAAYVTSDVIAAGQSFRLKLKAGGYLETVTGSITLGGAAPVSWLITSVAQDLIPDSFSIATVTGVQPNTDIVSVDIIPTGFDGTISIKGTNGASVSVAGAAYTDTATITAGQSFRLRVRSGDYTQTVVGAVTLGNASPVTWTVASLGESVATISGNIQNVNVSSYFGSDWQTARPKRLVISSGAVVGSTSTSLPALRTGMGWAGTLAVENNGAIKGAGGAANGGNGGAAFLADAPGVRLTNNGTIAGGGGGGGRGGVGGNGYTQVRLGEYYIRNGAFTYALMKQNTSEVQYYYNGEFMGRSFTDSPIWYSETVKFGRGSTIRNVSSQDGIDYFLFNITYDKATLTDGGLPGNGGKGAGYEGNAAPGAGGSAGGTGGGTGGTGGTGGGLGQSGLTGGNGATGTRYAGAAGSAGGLAGYAIQNASNVVLSGSGSVLGLR